MTINDNESPITPRARAIRNAALALNIPTNLIIDALQSDLGSAISFITPRDQFYAIAYPLFSSDDDFDDLIHELSHLILDATMRCDECDAECDLCCDC